MTLVQSEVNYRYVIVEMVAERGNAASIERGLFKGLNKVSDNAFLWIKPSETEDVSKSCNLSYYNILSIETYDGTTKCYTFFRKDKAEQKKAFSAITEIYDVLKEKILIKDDDYMLDTTKYSDIPTGLAAGSKNIVGKARTVAGSSGRSDFYGNCYHGSVGSYNSANSTVYQKKDPEPTAFKRRSKKPTENNLVALNEKLDLIAKGEYDTNFPKVKGEKKAAKGEVDVVDDGLEDYYDGLPPFS